MIADIGPDPMRVLMLWCPNWAILAARAAHDVPAEAPLALVDRGSVLACSPAAAQEGIAAGLRVRQAQHRCPDLVILPDDLAMQARAFEPVVRTLEEVIPDAQVVRPGLVAVRIHGARRFYGDEPRAVQAVLHHVHEHAERAALVRLAVADGLFTAEHAAYATTAQHPTRIVPEGGSTDFLARLPVEVACDDTLHKLLHRMGIRRLGQLAELPRAQAHVRFGAAGLHAHRLASGEDARALIPRALPPDLGMTVDFDPPATHLERILIGCEDAATEFVQMLTHGALICTEIRITVHVEPGAALEQTWRHPWQFGRAEVLDRIRWQLEDLAAEAVTVDDDGLPAAVLRVHVMPEALDTAAHHASGLWGDRPDEKVEHALTGLQHRLGRDSVLTATVAGGRLLHERRVLRPWGEALPTQRERRLEQPWPGSVPGPAPPIVFDTARQVRVHAEDGTPVGVDQRGEATYAPAWIHLPGTGRRRIDAWSGPWPINQRWWRKSRPMHRFQLIDNQSTAWLVICEGDTWWAEAHYD